MKGKGNLTVTNRYGIVVEERAFSAENKNILALDLSGQPNGLYNVYLSDEQLEVSKELLNLVNENVKVKI